MNTAVLIRVIGIATLSIQLIGCATMETVKKTGAAEGQSRSIQGDYEKTKAAAIETINRLNVELKESKET
jgi:hypothetical protein